MVFSASIYFIISSIIIILLIAKKFDLLQAYIFLLPFHSWYYNLGLNLATSQIIILVMIAKQVFLIPKKNNYFLFLGNNFVSLFLLYSILITMIISAIYNDTFIDAGGWLRSEGRFISQIIMLVFSFSIIPLFFIYIKKTDQIKHYLKTYLLSILILSILGWIQLFVFYFTEHDIFPLAIDESGVIRSGVWQVAGINFFRMSSLGGEPKNLSISLVLGFFILKSFNNEKILFFKKYDNLIKLVFILSLIVTASTSGMVLLAILFAASLLLDRLIKPSFIKPKISKINFFHASFYTVIIIFVAIKYWDYINIFLQARIFERNITSEDFDYPIQEFLKNNFGFISTGVGLGNVHNFAFSYIPNETMHYMKNTIFVAKSGYLKIISETGIIGLMLFLSIPFSLFYKIKKRLNENLLSTEAKVVVKPLLVSLMLFLLAFLARSYCFNEYLFILSMCFTIVSFKNVQIQ